MSTLPRPLKWPPIFPIEKGLVVWLPLDERSGAIAYDRSGKKNHGTLYGPTWVPRGLSFTAEYVSIPHNPSINFGQLDSFSLGGRCRTTKTSREWLVQKYFGGDPYYGIEINYPTTNKATFIIRDENDVSAYATSTTSVNDGKEHWVFGVRDVSAAKVRVYVDGILEEEVADGTTANIQNVSPLVIGRNSIVAAEYFSGVIYNVYVYNRAFSSAEAKRLAESELMLVRS